MGPFLRRHRELLVVVFLLVLPLATYVSHARYGFTPGPLRQGLVQVTAPLQRLLVWAGDEVRATWTAYVDLRDVHAKNEALTREVAALTEELQRLGEVAAENARLRPLVSFLESQPEVRMVTAPVIAYGPDPKFRGIRIGLGSADGLLPGMAVVTAEGVVGRLLNVYPEVADVLLITDPQSAVAVLSQRTRARASARGTGDSGRLKIDYLVRSEDVEEGDLLVTAPSGGLFPRGLRVGRAARVNQPAHGLFKPADLIPAVDFARLDEVLVVLGGGSAASVLPQRPAQALAR